MFLEVALVCQNFPSDAAERGLFQVSFSMVIWTGKLRNIFRFPAGATGTGVCSYGVKWPELEADHSSTSCAEFKNERSCAYTPNVCCHGVQRGDLNFTSVTSERHEIKNEREPF